MTTDPVYINLIEQHLATRLAQTITATPRNHWGTTQCVAWIDTADKRCTRDQATGFLCKRHHQAALNRLSKQLTRDHAARFKAAQDHKKRLPKLMAEREQVLTAITKLDPPETGDTAAYAGEVHPNIRRQQLARLSDARVSELARLYDRLEKLNRVIGGDA